MRRPQDSSSTHWCINLVLQAVEGALGGLGHRRSATVWEVAALAVADGLASRADALRGLVGGVFDEAVRALPATGILRGADGLVVLGV